MMQASESGDTRLLYAHGDVTLRLEKDVTAMPKQLKLPSYAELTAQVVQEAVQPISFDEIMRRVQALRPIETRSPSGTIRGAIAQHRLIAPDGKGGYGWSPRMLQGARMRVPLRDIDLKHQPARVEFGDDARELLWPAFFAIAKYSDREPVEVALPSGVTTRLPLDFFGSGQWGTFGTSDFWAWLKEVKARAGDDLIFQAVDAEARRYRVEHVPAASRDTAAITARTVEMIEMGVQLLQSSRGKSAASIWDMARLLAVMGQYAHLTPPAPITDLWPAMLRRMNGESPHKGDVMQIKIILEGTSPEVWRRVLVPATWNLGALHYVMQIAMGWTNSHLHHFIIGNETTHNFYSLYAHEDDTLGTLDSAGVKLADVLFAGREIYYEYDFGDSWIHRIEVENILPANGHSLFPWCVDGQYACPPEDCGGIGGYAHLLEVLRNPKHPEYEDMRAWLDGMYIGDFNPERFDMAAVNIALDRINPQKLEAERYVDVFSAMRF